MASAVEGFGEALSRKIIFYPQFPRVPFATNAPDSEEAGTAISPWRQHFRTGHAPTSCGSANLVIRKYMIVYKPAL